MVAFAKLLTAIENEGVRSLNHADLLHPKHSALRIGITGPPGSGKSTLISELLKFATRNYKKVGIVAVDPSSPITQGAILGDRIRYAEHSLQSNVFIRSLGTRGSLGGLSSSAYLMLRAFDLCEFDLVLIETVGVGQVEVEIMHVADYIVVVLVPESGDSIQAMKAGVLEIADLFVVNKKDRPGAEVLKKEIEASVALSSNLKNVQVLLTSAQSGEGVAELMAHLQSAVDVSKIHLNREKPVRLQHEAKALLRHQLDQKAERLVVRISSPAEMLKVLLQDI